MENWKKEIIIDPHLNGLFDTDLSPRQFLHSKVLTLPHPDVIKVYMKLTSLRHAITKNMQKEVEGRHPLIETSFQDSLRSKSAYEHINQDSMSHHLQQIAKFNEKYELISDRATEIKNINKILHFSKALEKFKVNVRLLKSMMQDFDHTSQSKLHHELLNTLKVSKLIKDLSSITNKFDFSGIRSYREDRTFIASTRDALFSLIEKQLTLALDRIPSDSQQKREEMEK